MSLANLTNKDVGHSLGVAYLTDIVAQQGINAVVAGNGINVDDTNPLRPVVSNAGITELTFNTAPFTGSVVIQGNDGIDLNIINATTVGIANSGMLSLNTQNGNVVLGSKNGSITVNTSAGNIDLAVGSAPSAGVASLSDGTTALTGAITLMGQGCSIVATTEPTPTMTVSITGIQSLSTSNGSGIALGAMSKVGDVPISTSLTSADGSLTFTPSPTSSGLDLSVVSASNIVINPTSTDIRGIQILSNSTGATAPSINWYNANGDVLNDTPPVNIQWDTNDSDPALTVQCYSNKSGGVATNQYPITSYVGVWVSGTHYAKGSIAISPLNNNAYICLVFTSGVQDPSIATGVWLALNASVGGVSSISDGTTSLTGAVSLLAGEGIEITTNAETNTMTLASDPFVGDYWFGTQSTFTNINIGTAIFDAQDPNNDNTVVSYDTTSGIFTVLKAGVYQLNWTCSVSANSAVWETLTSAEAFISVLLDTSTRRNTSTTLYVPYPNGASSAGFRIQANCVISLNVGSTFNFGLQWGTAPTGSWGFYIRNNTNGLGAFASWSFIKPL